MVDLRVNWRLSLYTADPGPFGHHAGVQFTWRSATAIGSQPRWLHRRFALRPILDGEGYRPYYVAGYAGASYGPGLFSRRSLVGLPTAPGPAIPNVAVEQGTWDPQ